jgi:hypothetical protein
MSVPFFHFYIPLLLLGFGLLLATPPTGCGGLHFPALTEEGDRLFSKCVILLGRAEGMAD